MRLTKIIHTRPLEIYKALKIGMRRLTFYCYLKLTARELFNLNKNLYQHRNPLLKIYLLDKDSYANIITETQLIDYS